MHKKLKIVFMGTPEFAVPSLNILLENGFQVAAVVTAPDKPAGRGRKIIQSPVKLFAQRKGLTVLQPSNLKDHSFVDQLGSLKTNLQVVVAFRMLPIEVWSIPAYGTFNLHASLLPQYRGAAPINHAIMNGEKETGVTTFFIDEKIDTGRIIMQKKTAIGAGETAGELHNRLMFLGAELVLQTLIKIENNQITPTKQDLLFDSNKQLKPAPKIFTKDCAIDWNLPSDKIFNRIRGLSPYPAAYTHLVSPDQNMHKIKIFKSKILASSGDFNPGSLITDGKKFLNITTHDGEIGLLQVQLAGKRNMSINEFLRGFQMNGPWHAK